MEIFKNSRSQIAPEDIKEVSYFNSERLYTAVFAIIS